MTIAYWCLLIGGFLPWIWSIVAKQIGGNKFDAESNLTPREWLAAQTGAAQRADWAQQNAFEAFPFFAAAVLAAAVAGADQGRVDLLAMIWVACRLAHGVFYTIDKGMLRSLAYLGGVICVVAIFLAI